MKTIKIIDLFNKIANGEEVPKELWYRGRLYKYIEDNNIAYCYTFRNPMQTLGLISMVDSLTDEVEILDEEDEFEDIEFDEDDFYSENPVIDDLTTIIGNLIKNQKKIIERLKEDNEGQI